MKSDIIYTDDGQTLTYFSRSVPSIRVTVPREPIYRAAKMAKTCDIGGFSHPVSSFAEGAWNFKNVCTAARFFARMARALANRPRYRGQADDVDRLTEAHRACAAVMRHPEMTDDEDTASAMAMDKAAAFPGTYGKFAQSRGTTDHEIDDVDLRDDLRDRGRE